jgi:hypothetical protein
MTKILKVFVVAGCILIGCELSFACESASNETPKNVTGEKDSMTINVYKSGEEVESPIKDLLDEYILDSRGWDQKDYYLTGKDNGESMLEVYVHFKNDINATLPGAGKSFIVCFDKRKMKIVRELALQ